MFFGEGLTFFPSSSSVKDNNARVTSWTLFGLFAE
jgi:hypothetical protein